MPPSAFSTVMKDLKMKWGFFYDFLRRSTILNLLHLWAGCHLHFICSLVLLRTLRNLIRLFVSSWQSPNLYGGHGSSRAYQRKQRAHCDDTLLMGPSSMDSTTVTRHEQINSIQSDFPSIHKAQHAPIPHSFMEQEGISAKRDQFLGGISSTASKHKVRILNWRTKNMEATCVYLVNEIKFFRYIFAGQRRCKASC